MKPVDQTSDSDCLRASIASIFELPIEAVPFFGQSAIGTDRANRAQDWDLRQWLDARGVGLIHVTNPKAVFANGGKSAQVPWGFCVGGGKSPRGAWDHAVVYDARQSIPVLAHDPHPSRAGLDGDPVYYTCFLLDDPGLWREWCFQREGGTVNMTHVCICGFQAPDENYLTQHKASCSWFIREDRDHTMKSLEAANLKIQKLGFLTRRVILNRACTCNKPDHRCGTNQMLEDLEAILGKEPECDHFWRLAGMDTGGNTFQCDKCWKIRYMRRGQ